MAEIEGEEIICVEPPGSGAHLCDFQKWNTAIGESERGETRGSGVITSCVKEASLEGSKEERSHDEAWENSGNILDLGFSPSLCPEVSHGYRFVSLYYRNLFSNISIYVFTILDI